MIKGNERFPDFDVLRLMFADRYVVMHNDKEKPAIGTFEDVLDLAVYLGYKSSDVLIVIADKTMKGRGFIYNNLPQIWSEYCRTNGYM